MGPRAGLDRCGKSPLYRDSIPGPSSPKKSDIIYSVAKSEIMHSCICESVFPYDIEPNYFLLKYSGGYLLSPIPEDGV